MILVLCLNPAVDKSCVLRRFKARGRNVLSDVLTLPGGKGINVARVLRSLGDRPMLLGWTAGFTGDFIEDAARREGLSGRWVRLPRGDSRICLTVLDGGRTPTEANESGPTVRPGDLARLLKEYSALVPRARLVLISGSLPLGCKPGLYARLIRIAHRAGKPVFLDSSQPALAPAAACRPDLVKVNEAEAAESGPGDPVKRLLALGAANAVVTLGERGAVGFLGGRRLRARAPATRSLSAVGCGDTFLAGLAHARLRDWAPERSLAFATALATASARTLGAGVYRPKDVPGILRKVKVARI